MSLNENQDGSIPEMPDFETWLQDNLGVRHSQVAYKTINFSLSADYPGAKVIKRTTVVSVIEKNGRVSNLMPGETK